jgi:hypothetical protein
MLSATCYWRNPRLAWVHDDDEEALDEIEATLAFLRSIGAP